MGTYYFTVNGARLCDSNRNDLSGADDTFSAQLYQNSYIIATSLWGGNNRDTAAKEIRLEWKHSSDGSYNALSGSGDIDWNATTVLTNGTGVTSGNSKCTQEGVTTFEATAVEREGANNQTVDLGNDGSSEAQWAIYVNTAGTYDFQVYDVSLGASMKTFQIRFRDPAAYRPAIITVSV